MDNISPFSVFQKMVPSTKEVVDIHFSKLKSQIDINDFKNNFSFHFQFLHDQIYKEFLILQSKAFNKAFENDLYHKELSFERFDSFFLSLSNSRKVRSGAVFEKILERMLTHLSYPLDIQKKVDNKKVDFVLPSINFYNNDPLNSILLSAKRTLRERWKQVVPEANKSNLFFLATIDEDITADQLKEMQKHRVFIVNTKKNINYISHYKEANNMISFEHFIDFYLDHQMKSWEEK